jgi:hypothetical protein
MFIYLGTQGAQQATDQNIRNDHLGILRYIHRCDPLTPWARFGLLSKKVLCRPSVGVDTNNLGPEISASYDSQANDLGARGCRHPQACPQVLVLSLCDSQYNTATRTRRMALVRTPKNRMLESPRISQSHQVGLFDMMGWILATSCLASGAKTRVECWRLGLTFLFYNGWIESEGLSNHWQYSRLRQLGLPVDLGLDFASFRIRPCHVIQGVSLPIVTDIYAAVSRSPGTWPFFKPMTRIVLCGTGTNVTPADSALQYKGLWTFQTDPGAMDGDTQPSSISNGGSALRLGSRKKPWLSFSLFHFPITDAVVTGAVVIPSCIMADISVGQCTRCAMSGP